MASAALISVSTVRSIEAGRFERVPYKLRAIAKVLGVHTQTLVTGTPPEGAVTRRRADRDDELTEQVTAERRADPRIRFSGATEDGHDSATG